MSTEVFVNLTEMLDMVFDFEPLEVNFCQPILCSWESKFSSGVELWPLGLAFYHLKVQFRFWKSIWTSAGRF